METHGVDQDTARHAIWAAADIAIQLATPVPGSESSRTASDFRLARLFGRLAAWHVIKCRANKVGDHLKVNLSGGRIVEATVDDVEPRRASLQVSFGEVWNF